MALIGKGEARLSQSVRVPEHTGQFAPPPRVAAKASAHVDRRLEWVLFVLAAALLLAPARAGAVGLLVLGASWLARRAAIGTWTERTGAELPMAILAAMSLVSLIP